MDSPSFSRKREFVDCATVGEPVGKKNRESKPSDTASIKFTIHNFGNRPHDIESPFLSAHGHKWKIKVFPRCGKTGHEKEVLCVLELFSTDPHPFASYLRPREDSEMTTKGKKSRIRFDRKDILENYLEEDGSLVLDIDIRMAAKVQKVWYPKIPQRQDILVELYENNDSDTFDVAFSVDGELFRAHKSILSLRCKKLYETARESTKSCEATVGVWIDDVEAAVFRDLLDFVYTVKIPPIPSMDVAMKLLETADRFGCVSLKLYTESILVDKFLCAKNAVAMLILGDSVPCALLKEAAIRLVLKDVRGAKKSQNEWNQIKESGRLLEELFDASMSWQNDYLEECAGDEEEKNAIVEIDAMDVACLRDKLDEAKLDLDGSREMLVDRLLAHKKKKPVNKRIKSEVG